MPSLGRLKLVTDEQKKNRWLCMKEDIRASDLGVVTLDMDQPPYIHKVTLKLPFRVTRGLPMWG